MGRQMLLRDCDGRPAAAAESVRGLSRAGTGAPMESRRRAMLSCLTRTGGLVAALATIACLVLASSAVALTPVPGSPFAIGTHPQTVAFSPGGGWLATTNYPANTVSVFSVNQTSGALTQASGSPFLTQTDPYSLAFSPSGGLLAVANSTPDNAAGTVSVFSVDQTSGAIVPVSGSPFATGSYSDSVAFSPSGGLLATASLGDGTVSVFSVNQATGGLTPVAGSPFTTGATPTSVAFSPSGGQLAVATTEGSNTATGAVAVFSVNQASGALNPVSGSPFATGPQPVSVAFSPTGGLLATADAEGLDGDTVSVFSFDQTSGALTPVSGSPFLTGRAPGSVAFSPRGGLLATANQLDDSVSVFSVNQGSGALTPVSGSPVETGAGPGSVAFSPSGALLATANSSGSGGVSVFFTGPSPVTTPPVSTTPPTITGATKPGGILTCLQGSWTNTPTTFAYQWYRNGTSLAGFTSSTYKLGTLDEGATFTCVVTATNAAGSASASSSAVKIAIPKVVHCPGATGTMTGTTIGQITLGMTQARARYLYRQHSNRGRQYQDFFCLTPIGVRVGYTSPVLLKTLSKPEQASLRGKVVWASTSNPYYALDGVRAGEAITVASNALGTESPIHVGLNYWYLARKPGYTAVLKVRGDVVEELGIATNALTATRKAQVVLMHSFY